MKILLLIILLSLSSCRIEYNYIILPTKEVKKDAKKEVKKEIKQYPAPDRWNYVDVKRLERVSDSISNILNNHDTW